MYGIYANIWGILMVNVTIYSIHGSYGLGHDAHFLVQSKNFPRKPFPIQNQTSFSGRTGIWAIRPLLFAPLCEFSLFFVCGKSEVTQNGVKHRQKQWDLIHHKGLNIADFWWTTIILHGIFSAIAPKHQGWMVWPHEGCHPISTETIASTVLYLTVCHGKWWPIEIDGFYLLMAWWFSMANC